MPSVLGGKGSGPGFTAATVLAGARANLTVLATRSKFEDWAGRAIVSPVHATKPQDTLLAPSPEQPGMPSCAVPLSAHGNAAERSQGQEATEGNVIASRNTQAINTCHDCRLGSRVDIR